MSEQIIAVLATAILAGLAVFQLALASGAPLGKFAWGGQHRRVLPARLRVGSFVSIFIYGFFALVALDKTSLVDLFGTGIVGVMAWVITAYLMLGIVMNMVSRSKSERIVMTPVVTVLAVLFLIISLS